MYKLLFYLSSCLTLNMKTIIHKKHFSIRHIYCSTLPNMDLPHLFTFKGMKETSNE